MPAKRKWTEDQIDDLRKLFSTELTNREVAKRFGCDYNRSIKAVWLEMFGEEAVHDRFRRSCARSKMGDKNPMLGKTAELHPRHKESYIAATGYRMVNVPDWWEGSRKASKYLEHVIIGCEKYGLTKPVKGYVFHHKDDDKLNNDPDNLEMMTISDHMKHHSNERKVQRLSRKGVDSK